MSRLPPFTLMHVPRNVGGDVHIRLPWAEVESSSTWRKAEPEALSVLLAAKPKLAKRWHSLSFDFRRTLWASAQSVSPNSAGSALLSVLRDLDRDAKVATIAVWDLDARVGFLPNELSALNRAQAAITFFTLQAAIPVGLISQPSRTLKWLGSEAKGLSPSELCDVEENTVADDYFVRARGIRSETGVDLLMGIAAKMLAFTDDDGSRKWNFFSVGKGDVALSSTYELRSFAKKANRPFARAVAMVLVAQALSELGDVEFHEKPHAKGSPCLFDFNEDRVSIVDNFRKPSIHPECLEKLSIQYRDAAVAMTRMLAE